MDESAKKEAMASPKYHISTAQGMSHELLDSQVCRIKADETCRAFVADLCKEDGFRSLDQRNAYAVLSSVSSETTLLIEYSFPADKITKTSGESQASLRVHRCCVAQTIRVASLLQFCRSFSRQHVSTLSPVCHVSSSRFVSSCATQASMDCQQTSIHPSKSSLQ